MRNKKNAFEHIKPYFYLFPSAFLVCAFFIYSFLVTFYYSFTDWDGLKTPNLVGLKNYLRIFTDKAMVNSVKNTVIWVIATLILSVGIGFILALSLNSLRHSRVLKSIFYLPYAFSATTTAVIFAFLLRKNGIPYIFSLLNVEKLSSSWLQQPFINTISMILASTWQSAGVNMVLFLVGLQAMPKEPVEAAMIDGATGWKMFTKITFPLLMPITSVVVLMAIVNSFKVFDIIWVMTGGGPYRSSETLAVSMYREAFMFNRYGYGSAIAMVISVIALAFSWGYMKILLAKGERQYE